MLETLIDICHETILSSCLSIWRNLIESLYSECLSLVDYIVMANFTTLEFSADAWEETLVKHAQKLNQQVAQNSQELSKILTEVEEKAHTKTQKSYRGF